MTQFMSSPPTGMLVFYGDPSAGFLAPGGGINIFTLNLTRALAERGASVRLFSPRYADQNNIEPHVPTKLLELGLERMEKSELYIRMDEFVIRSEPYVQELSSLGCIYSHYWLSGVYWRRLRAVFPSLSRVPWLHTFHSLGRVRCQSVSDQDVKPRIHEEELIISEADCIIVNSLAEARDLESLYKSKAVRCEELPGGYRSEQFVAGESGYLQKILGFEPEQRIVVFVGRFEERKGVFVFLELALAMLEDTQLRFVMVGGRCDISYESEVLARARRWANENRVANLSLLPPLAHNELHKVYQSSRYIVIPSSYEPFGMTALEAQGCGCVPIASSVGGLTSTIINGETGYLTDNSVDAYRERLRYLEARPDVYDELSREARRRVKRDFSWERAGESLDALIGSWS